MNEIALYGHPDSGHACKVALALSLAGLAYRPVRVDIWGDPATREPAFLAASPLAQVPLLRIGDETFVQSGAILLEIAQRFRCLGGECTARLARCREIIMWEANRIGMCLPQLIDARRSNGSAVPEGAVTWLTQRYNVDCESFGRLLADRPFFDGASPGIGDCAVWGYVQWLDKAGVEPTLIMRDWVRRMQRLDEMRTPDGFFPS